VAVEVARHIEGEIRRDPQTHRSHDRVQHVEVVVEELLAAGLDQSVGGVAALGGEPRRVRDERSVLLHARQDTSDPFALPLQAAIVRQDEIFFPLPFGRLENRDPTVRGVPAHPVAVAVGAAHQDRWLDALDAGHLVEEVDEVLRPLQAFDIPIQNDAVEGDVRELDILTQQLR
jgi:hypothetical protein